MKTRKTRQNILASTIAALTGVVLTNTAPAANLFWDGTDLTANADGGSGIWNTLNANWDTALLGGANATWNNATPDFAIFGGTAGTVTLGEDMTVDGIRFATGGYTIALAPVWWTIGE